MLDARPAAVGGWKLEDRKQSSDDRGQMTEDRIQITDAGNQIAGIVHSRKPLDPH